MADLVWPEFYFVRHGETDWNAEGRYQGSKDIPLNERGRGQAALNGELLQQFSSAIIASPPISAGTSRRSAAPAKP